MMQYLTLQCYVDSPDNIYVLDGALHLTARKASDGSITSGRLTTQGKVEIAYGRWEARLKVPGVLGTWPAFWTLGNDISEAGWPTCAQHGQSGLAHSFPCGHPPLRCVGHLRAQRSPLSPPH